MTSPPCVVTRLLLFGFELCVCVYRLHVVIVWPSYQSWTIFETRLLCLSVEVSMQIQVGDAGREFVGNCKKTSWKRQNMQNPFLIQSISVPEKKIIRLLCFLWTWCSDFRECLSTLRQLIFGTGERLIKHLARRKKPAANFHSSPPRPSLKNGRQSPITTILLNRPFIGNLF